MPDTPEPTPADDAPSGREPELPSSRDADDFLIIREKATRDRFKDLVALTIDGYPVVIPRSVPKTDSQGNVLRGADGEPIPRNTTIYDAAVRLVNGYSRPDGAFVPGVWSPDELKERIPTLCHMQHLHPVGVCRMCSVSVAKWTKKKDDTIELKGGRKLSPACWHETQDKIAVLTRKAVAGLDPTAPTRFSAAELKAYGDEAKKAQKLIDRSIGLLAELLLADHKPEPLAWEANGTDYCEGKRYENELEAVAGRLCVPPVRERLQRPMAAFSRNRMATVEPCDTDPHRPHTKALRRIPLDTLAPTAVSPENRGLGADPLAAWEAWNRHVDDNFPYSSRTVVVDHNKCILCDRCVRSCTDVRDFNIIGHTGKGYATRISFGLDARMGPRARHDGEADANLLHSGCVQCGECMTACPTGALSLRRRVQPQAWTDAPKLIPQNPNTPFRDDSGFLTADEMREVRLAYRIGSEQRERTLEPFRSIPYAYLKWNEGAVRRIEIRPGERRELCREGEYGSTAFLLNGTGEFWIYEWENTEVPPPASSWFDRLLGRKPARPQPPPEPEGHPKYGWKKYTRRGHDLVLGEMACLTNRPRAASVLAVADRSLTTPVVVYEVTRNMLDMMQRAPEARDDIATIYTLRAIQVCLSKARLFKDLSFAQEQERVNFLLDNGKLDYRRVREGELVVREGDEAADFYVIRLGTVEIYSTATDRKRTLALRSAGEHFGEFALMGDRPSARTATAAALDPTELIRIPGATFRAFLNRFPDVRTQLLAAKRGPVAGLTATLSSGVLDSYVRQGLYQAQKVLALDLLSCTRCDECTKACADSHDGHARLLREGLRFGDFLIPASCRSCHKPYCMEGCPVDAIHRKGDRLEVVIEDHCIGCGLCERNCPYGSIQMVPRDEPNVAALAAEAVAAGGNPHLTAARRAVNCDLCGSVGGDPFCVSACPHEAAFRMDGLQLLIEVNARANQ